MLTPDFNSLRSIYWFIRYNRKFNEAKRRQYYRRAAKEKQRLIAMGYDSELVRLACRAFIHPRNEAAADRVTKLWGVLGGVAP